MEGGCSPSLKTLKNRWSIRHPKCAKTWLVRHVGLNVPRSQQNSQRNIWLARENTNGGVQSRYICLIRGGGGGSTRRLTLPRFVPSCSTSLVPPCSPNTKEQSGEVRDGEVGFAGPKSRTPALFSSCLANTEDFTVSNFPALFSHKENKAGKFETVELGSPVQNFGLQLFGVYFFFVFGKQGGLHRLKLPCMLRFHTKKTKPGCSRRCSWVCRSKISDSSFFFFVFGKHQRLYNKL
jgi:hypothetical protein